MDVGHGRSFYQNLSSIRGANNDDDFPRFSRQRCGGSNCNGLVFQSYSNSSQLLASARAAHAAGNVHAPRGSLTLEEVAGEHSMAKRMQATADFNATHPNVFRVKPMVKPALPDEARGSGPSSPRRRTQAPTPSGAGFSPRRLLGVSPRSQMRASGVVGPTSAMPREGKTPARQPQGPFLYRRSTQPLLPPL